jgi:RAB protein geranylgeranyltransferase component A
VETVDRFAKKRHNATITIKEKHMIKKFIEWIKWPARKLKERKEFKKRLKELKDRDPFIYP